MYIKYQNPNANHNIDVLGIPFEVQKNNKGIIEKISDSFIDFSGKCEALFFLGMTTDNWKCSEWWGQQETKYDHSTRLFIGERIGHIDVRYDDNTQDMVSVIFGVNAFNYNLFFKSQETEDKNNTFNAPYNEPFRSDINAYNLLSSSLILGENTSKDVQKHSKFVFAYRPRNDKKIIGISFGYEPAKKAGFAVSAITGLLSGEEYTHNIPIVNESYFLGKKYYAAAEKLKRRLYQYKDELPQSVELEEIENFDAPDIRFYNEYGIDILTNVYRKNVMDMAHQKIDDDGMTHTSSKIAADFGCYVGFGSYAIGKTYYDHVWSRDLGRTVLEAIRLGYFERCEKAVEKFHEFLYYPSVRFDFPHWKRIANIPITKEKNSQEEIRKHDGLENDGHASIMTAIYTLWAKGAVNNEWLKKNIKHLKSAVDCYFYQIENSSLSNFYNIFYSHSEASTQTMGGYDFYSNILICYALDMYACMFDALEETNYANRCREVANSVREQAFKIFTFEHNKYGKVTTDTTDDCWTYEYKRFAPIMIQSDFKTYDTYKNNLELFDMMLRTFNVQKESFYNPYSGRQMGYGQGYLTETVLLLDLPNEYTDCVNAAAQFCYHHSDFPYIVPEGVIMHGSGNYWYRNSDLGNGVQQAEIIKSIRLVCGIDDLSKTENYSIIPRMPQTLNRMTIKNFPVILPNRSKILISYEYGKGDGDIKVKVGECSYYANLKASVLPSYIRFGPFPNQTDAYVTGGEILSQCNINGYKYVYVRPNL